MDENYILTNYRDLDNEISSLAKLYKVTKPKLVIVTKYQELPKIETLLANGHKYFAENIVQDAQKKWFDLKTQYPQSQLQMIGHLQSNKVKQAVALFDLIASVDSLKLARKIKAEMVQQNKNLKIYLQVNISQEEQKHGFSLAEIDAAIPIVRNEIKLEIAGLMGIAAQNKNPTPAFALLKEIAKKHNIEICSIGMSNDYEKAIAVQTNEVRIGSRIFKKS